MFVYKKLTPLLVFERRSSCICLSLSTCLSALDVDVVVAVVEADVVAVTDVVLLVTLTSSAVVPHICLVRSLFGEVGDTPGDRLGRSVDTFRSSLGDVRLLARTVLGSLGDGGFGEVGFTGDRSGDVSVCRGSSAVGDVGVMCPMLGNA